MKQFKLRESKSFVKILKEPVKEKKKVNWNRRVYLAIIIGLVFIVARRAYRANMIIQANGQIELPKQTIKLTNDIQILSLHVEEGKSVCSGDTLFAYKITGTALDQAKINQKESSGIDWITKEILGLKKKIQLNKILAEQKSNSLLMINQSLKTKESLLLSGINNEYQSYSSLQNQKASVLAEIEFYKEENKILKNQLYQLYSQEKSLMVNTKSLNVYDKTHYYTSPLDGVISDVFYEVNEICYKKEEMMTIHQLNNATINTYFDQEEMKYLEEGDVVVVKFPDNRITNGVISKFLVSTYAVPSEFQKKYEPTERNIVAEVKPLSRKDENMWNNFYKMEVSVHKMRFGFDFLFN